jgi:hypothetical protein
MILVNVQHVWIAWIILVGGNQAAIPDTSQGVDIRIGQGDDAISSGCNWDCTEAWRGRASALSRVRSDTFVIGLNLTLLTSPATSTVTSWLGSSLPTSAGKRPRQCQIPVWGVSPRSRHSEDHVYLSRVPEGEAKTLCYALSS